MSNQISESLLKAFAADERFFERNANRTCRLRRAFPIEIKVLPHFADDPLSGYRCFIMVRRVAPGVTVRRPLCPPAKTETDLSEQDTLRLHDLFELMAGALAAHRESGA